MCKSKQLWVGTNRPNNPKNLKYFKPKKESEMIQLHYYLLGVKTYSFSDLRRRKLIPKRVQFSNINYGLHFFLLSIMYVRVIPQIQ
jgi:hypothetical protein